MSRRRLGVGLSITIALLWPLAAQGWAASGPVAAYSFNAGTGMTVVDASGNANTGTLSGATWAAAGKFGNALSFDASKRSNLVTVPDSASLRLATGMTIEGWVNPSTLGTNPQSWRTVALKERTGGMAYALYANNRSARPTGQVYVGGEQNVAGTAQLALNIWTHLATTYDGANLRLYVNGAQVATKAQTGSIIASTGALRIGGNSLWGEWFGGLIDEVRIYNRALTAAEIQTDMTTAVAPDNVPPSTPTGLTQTGRTENSVSLAWNASNDNVGVTGYGLYLGGVSKGSSPTTSATIGGLACSSTSTAAVDAADAAGNRSGQTSITVTTSPCDTTPPTVEITSPAGGTMLNGTVVVSATAADDIGVAGVQFKLDGAVLGIEDTASPYSVSWDTTTALSGSHTLTAVARDASNNLTTSAPVAVTVSNLAPRFVNDTLITGLSEPTAIAFTPDGRMLVTERDGTVWIAQPGALKVDATPFLQLPSVVTADERGVLGITVDPVFATNGYVYIYYTNSVTQKNRVSRFTASGNTASLASEFVVWQNDTAADIWHQGGDLVFGSDGYLYISVGDHLLPATAQRLDSFNGKILRVRSDGTVPTDNPFYDGTGPNKDAVWSLGLRNPFRITIDASTGRMYIGDVGQDTWEEVDLGARGANYGWPTCEGTCTAAGMTNPLYTYSHNGHDAAVVGGFVYRGGQFPSAYQGTYFFGDYAENWIRRLVPDGSGNLTVVANFEPPDGSLDGPYGDIVAFAMAPDGSLYYVDNGPFAANNAGSIRRIKNVNANQPPTAQTAASPTSGPAPLAVTFSSAGSTDPEGQPLTYSWDFGDGAMSTATDPSHTYTANGRYTVRLTTSDGTNQTGSTPLTITVGNPPSATIVAPADGLKFRAGDTIDLSGSAADPEDGTLPASALSWKIVFHHEQHIHPGPGPFTGTSAFFTIPTSGHSFSGNTSYEVVLTATDSDGIQTQTSVTIYPDKVDLTFAGQPPGLTVGVDGVPQTTPFAYDTLIGFQHTVDTSSPQTLGANRYAFGSWSDGGAQTHQITAPATARTYTATFTLVSTAPAGLVAAYNFNEGNGGTLYDVSGAGNNGALSGPVWTGTGKNGGAASFDGVNDWITVNDANSLDFQAGMTIEAWVDPTALGTTGSSWRCVAFKEQSLGMIYALYANNGGARPVGQVNVGGEKNAVGGAQLPLNTWTHLATTYDGASLRLYVNSTQVASISVGGVIPASTGALRLGGNAVWGEWFQGQMDDVRLYNRALSATEIQGDMNTPVG
jgi:glucose/arabinose dehydrogenase